MWIANAAENKENQTIIDRNRGRLLPTGMTAGTRAAAGLQPTVGTRAAAGHEDNDSVTISDEGKERLEAQQEEKRAKEQENRLLQMLEEQRRRYEEQREANNQSAKTAQDFAKVMEIARRIANGDRVPGTDEKKLMEYNSDLYQAAKAAAIVSANKKEHKEYDALFKEEKKDGRSMLRALERETSDGLSQELFAETPAAAEASAESGGDA
ncbi:MAG: hypothetical protein NC337_10850 [Roseburia sp.]|nr:hypothetical protein [Roseburia sp.]